MREREELRPRPHASSSQPMTMARKREEKKKVSKSGGQGSSSFALLALVVVRHLQAGAAEPALDVEALVGLAAVENALVAPDLLGDVVEGLDDAQAELLALLVLGDGDV